MDPGSSARKNERGVSLVITMFLLLVTISIATFLAQRTAQDLRHAVMHRKIRTATNLATSITTDIMRQFSQSFQGDHYSSAALDRNPAFYSKGYSVIVTSANMNQHFVAFQAQGKYGTDENNPQNIKKINGVIKFISDLTTFGTMSNTNFTTSASDVVYSGKVWINGTWRITGSNVRVQGGPVFVATNITATNAFTINGDLYRGGSRSGPITVLGSDYTYMPAFTWPTIDSTYFDAYSNVALTANTTLVFSSGAANGTVRVGTTTYTIPSDGFIIYGKNCVLTASGCVQGRVTVASIRVSGAVGGGITMNGNLFYAMAGSSFSANSRDSFAAIASHDINFNKTGANLHCTGVYWSDNAAGNLACNGDAGRDFHLHGTRNKIMSISGFDLTASYDTNLDTYPPPGLPERPYLVKWQIK